MHQAIEVVKSKSCYLQLLDLDLAHNSLGHLTVARCVNYIAYSFGAGNDEIMVEDAVTTPVDLVRECSPGLLASRIHLVFWGGPPGDEDWYHGSLLVMLIDRLFYNVAAGNNEVVSSFLDGIVGNH